MSRVLRNCAILVLVLGATVLFQEAARAVTVSSPASGKLNFNTGNRTVTPPATVFDIDFSYGCEAVPSALMQLFYLENGTVTGGCFGSWEISTGTYIHRDEIESTISGTVDGSGVMSFTYTVHFERSARPVANGGPTARTIVANDTYSGQLQVSGTFVDIQGFVHGPVAMVNFTHSRTCTPGTSTEFGLICQPIDTKTYSGTVAAWTALKPSPPANGIEIHHIEVLQVTQTDDPDNQVPILANKRGIIRVFVTGNVARDDFTVQLRARRNGVLLPETPALMTGSATAAISRSVYTSDIRRFFEFSFNFHIPDDWLSAGVLELEAEATMTPGSSYPPDANLANNKLTHQVQFWERPKLRVEYIPVCVQGDPPVCVDDYRLAEFPRLVERMYPLQEGGLVYKKADRQPLIITQLPTTLEQLVAIRDDIVKVAKIRRAMTSQPTFDQLLGWIQASPGSPAYGIADPPFTSTGAGQGLLVEFNANDLPFTYRTLAHELAHNLGRHHVGESIGCGAKDSQTDWPHLTGSIQHPGWDVAEEKIIPPSNLIHDIMSYCNGSISWISPFTYRTLFHAMGALESVPSLNERAFDFDLDLAIISGWANSAGTTGGIEDLHYVVNASENSDDTHVPGGSHCLRFDNAPAKDFCFDLEFESPDEEPMSSAAFTLAIKTPLNFNSVALLANGTPIATITRSANAPQLTLDPLPSFASGTQTISWQASDLDGDNLKYSVFHSPDNYFSWVPLALDLSETSFSIDVGDLAGGTSSVFKVVASDGINFGQAYTLNVIVGTPHPWGDILCDGALDLADVLAVRRHVAGLEQAPPIDCSAVTTLVTVFGHADALTWGDMDCDGASDAVDTLELIRSLAGLEPLVESSCPGPRDPSYVTH